MPADNLKLMIKLKAVCLCGQYHDIGINKQFNMMIDDDDDDHKTILSNVIGQLNFNFYHS